MPFIAACKLGVYFASMLVTVRQVFFCGLTETLKEKTRCSLALHQKVILAD